MNSFYVDKPADDVSPDGEDRIKDFLVRHGGCGASTQREVDSGATVGWYEVYAADGYALRCEWSRTGEREEMTFTELPPTAPR